jgi:hypothetical protein
LAGVTEYESHESQSGCPISKHVEVCKEEKYGYGPDTQNNCADEVQQQFAGLDRMGCNAVELHDSRVVRE